LEWKVQVAVVPITMISANSTVTAGGLVNKPGVSFITSRTTGQIQLWAVVLVFSILPGPSRKTTLSLPAGWHIAPENVFSSSAAIAAAPETRIGRAIRARRYSLLKTSSPPLDSPQARDA
jgi:hypothetical protein